MFGRSKGSIEASAKVEQGVESGRVIPLVGFDALPRGFKFKLRMYPFGGMRCFVVMPVDCLVRCLDHLGVGQCPQIIHEAIYRQLYSGSFDFVFADMEDLPGLIEIFSRYKCEWQHFDEWAQMVSGLEE